MEKVKSDAHVQVVQSTIEELLADWLVHNKDRTVICMVGDKTSDTDGLSIWQGGNRDMWAPSIAGLLHNISPVTRLQLALILAANDKEEFKPKVTTGRTKEEFIADHQTTDFDDLDSLLFDEEEA